MESKHNDKYDVFISYRSDRGSDFACHVFDRLSQEGFAPFMDTSGLRQGNYHKQLPEKIDECDYFVLILSQGALKRCKNPDDVFRREIETALNAKKHIVVIRLEGFEWPRSSQSIPESIRPIAFLQDIEAKRSIPFETTFQKLVEYLNDPNWDKSVYDEVRAPIEEEGRKSRKLFAGTVIACAFLLAGLSVAVVLWGIPTIEKAIKSAETPTVAHGWGDDGESSEGRVSYTIEQVNDGALGNEVVFNSISDSVIGDEKNFVAARYLSGSSNGSENQWNANTVEIEENASYRIRLYIHNDNPNGESASSKSTSICFLLPDEAGKELAVFGMIDSENAKPSRYWDSVVFRSDRDFRLEYVSGTALLENNGIGANGGIRLDDKVAKGQWTAIGYSGLDGVVPGCYQYASYATIVVRPVF